MNDANLSTTDLFARPDGAGGESRLPPDMIAGVLDLLPAAIYGTDAQGRIQFYNAAAAELWGTRPSLGSSEWCGSHRLYHPDGTPMLHGDCPMAVAIREGRAIHGREAIAERPDGTRVTFMAFPKPLFDESGAISGAVNILIEVHDRDEATHASHHLAAIVESSDDAIVSKDLDGTIRSWNQAAQNLFGYTPEEVIGKHITILIPEERHSEETEIIERIRNRQRIAHYETVRRRKDGSLIDVSLTVSPIIGIAGTVVGASKIARDISERKRAEERQTMLLGEMSHRVKNVLAVAGGLVALSARSADSPQAMAKAVQGRLTAYARAHELTRPGLLEEYSAARQQTTLHALIHAILEPYLDALTSEDPVIIEGVDLPVSGDAVTNLALVLHEFATNAAKYGALSTSDGRVRIACNVEGGKLTVIWEEQGGPRIETAPSRVGFGSKFTSSTVIGQLKGELNQEWKPDGVRIRVTVPVERLAHVRAD